MSILTPFRLYFAVDYIPRKNAYVSRYIVYVIGVVFEQTSLFSAAVRGCCFRFVISKAFAITLPYQMTLLKSYSNLFQHSE